MGKVVNFPQPRSSSSEYLAVMEVMGERLNAAMTDLEGHRGDGPPPLDHVKAMLELQAVHALFLMADELPDLRAPLASFARAVSAGEPGDLMHVLIGAELDPAAASLEGVGASADAVARGALQCLSAVSFEHATGRRAASALTIIDGMMRVARGWELIGFETAYERTLRERRAAGAERTGEKRREWWPIAARRAEAMARAHPDWTLAKIGREILAELKAAHSGTLPRTPEKVSERLRLLEQAGELRFPEGSASSKRPPPLA